MENDRSPCYILAMQRLQVFQYELMPNGQQKQQMRRFAGSCRFVFNKALALQQQIREAGGKYVRCGDGETSHGMAQWN